MTKILDTLRIILTTFTCLFGISIFFINSGTLCNMVVKAFHLKVDPKFVGGEIAADFFDDSEDDFGSGVLKYPLNKEFTEGSLDLLRYTVHQPVYNAKWQQSPDYWQIDLEFKSGTENVRNIMIYIGLSEEENSKLTKLNSSTTTLFEGAENVEFTSGIPWNFAIWLKGKEGNVYNANGEFICKTELGIENEGKTIKFRIPLKDKQLQRVYSATETYHYVCVGAYSQFDRGGFMPIEKRRSNSRGGTASSKDFNPLVPKIYDILGNNKQLADWNADELTKAVITPVKADMKLAVNSNQNEDKEFINMVVSELSIMQTTENNEEDKSSTGEYFGHSTLDQALTYYEIQLQKEPESAVNLAYYGSCLAMKGGQSSVVQAVAYVNNAFTYLDKAVELCKTDEEMVEVLMNRANVCKSVPESVFNKAKTGAEDFIKLAQLQKNSMKERNLTEDKYQKYMLSYLYINASQCYKTAGKDSEAKIILQEAKKALE